MDQLDVAMAADIDTYVAVLNCQCEALCTCDDTLALRAASMSVDIRPQDC